MTLTVHVFSDGNFYSKKDADSIATTIDDWLQEGWNVRETKRTRYSGLSRFHVYLYDAYDRSPNAAAATATLIFQFA